jgi:hypothetical protein
MTSTKVQAALKSTVKAAAASFQSGGMAAPVRLIRLRCRLLLGMKERR